MKLEPADITSLIGLLSALSIATERFVEIIKGYIPALASPATPPADANGIKAENRRQSTIQVLAVGCGAFTAWASSGMVTSIKVIGDLAATEGSRFLVYIVLGLLASGGSGFWNSISSWATGLKKPRA